MSEVRVAAAALYLRASHAVAGVGLGLDSLLIRRGVEARPPGARVVFGIRTKQRLATANALVYPRRVRVLVFPRKRRLCSLLAGHIVLIRRELLLPSDLVLADLFVHDCSLLSPYLAFALLSKAIRFAELGRRCSPDRGSTLNTQILT
jgi:hypothetical protein